MGRAPCCEKVGLNRGPWTREEDALLIQYITAHGEGSWRTLPKQAGLRRCGKSCRLRWINYLRPDLKRGNITEEEDELIIKLHSLLGNRWSLIASRLAGRTDNEIKNYWNTHLKKKLRSMGIDPHTHRPLEEVEQEAMQNRASCSCQRNKSANPGSSSSSSDQHNHNPPRPTRGRPSQRGRLSLHKLLSEEPEVNMSTLSKPPPGSKAWECSPPSPANLFSQSSSTIETEQAHHTLNSNIAYANYWEQSSRGLPPDPVVMAFPRPSSEFLTIPFEYNPINVDWEGHSVKAEQEAYTYQYGTPQEHGIWEDVDVVHQMEDMDHTMMVGGQPSANIPHEYWEHHQYNPIAKTDIALWPTKESNLRSEQ